MVSVNSKFCDEIVDDKKCMKVANFKSENGSWKCKNHKTENMNSTKSRKCSYIDEEGNRCKKIPSFGYQPCVPLRCVKHKDDDMEDVRNYVRKMLNKGK